MFMNMSIQCFETGRSSFQKRFEPFFMQKGISSWDIEIDSRMDCVVDYGAGMLIKKIKPNGPLVG
jgi:hypothetical protein